MVSGRERGMRRHLIAALGAILWFSVTSPKLQRFEEPDRALDLMVSRMLMHKTAFVERRNGSNGWLTGRW